MIDTSNIKYDATDDDDAAGFHSWPTNTLYWYYYTNRHYTDKTRLAVRIKINDAEWESYEQIGDVWLPWETKLMDDYMIDDDTFYD